MVRLKCLECSHTWRETKKQMESENVYCPKCNQLHHTHAKPIIPTDPPKIKKKKKVEVPVPQPVKPYEYKTWHQRGLGGRTVGFTPDKVNRSRTRKVEK